ncbi:MATE family efflux transporter [Novosphingobium colocasiae]
MTDFHALPAEPASAPFIPPGEDAAPERRVAPTGEPAQPRGARAGDLTSGPILKTLMVFALPMLASNVLQSLNGSVNAMWVGRLLGESALAATANGNVVLFVLVSAVFGFGMATTIKVGKSFGANDIAGLRRTFGSGLSFCVLLAIVVGIAGWVVAPSLLEMLSTPRESMVEALAYLRVVFVTMPFTMASVITSMAMRGAGDLRTPLHAMTLTVVIDIAMNPLLIRGAGPIPALGVAGSAFSTAVANLTGFLFQIWRIYAKGAVLALSRHELALLIPPAVTSLATSSARGCRWRRRCCWHPLPG